MQMLAKQVRRTAVGSPAALAEQAQWAAKWRVDGSNRAHQEQTIETKKEKGSIEVQST